MPETIIVSLIAFLGTLVGSIAGILTANKLTIYRIDQLEKKVEKHNMVIERVYALEKQEAVLEEEITDGYRRIERLEEYHK